LTGALSANNSAGVTARNTIKAFGKVINSSLVVDSCFNISGLVDNGTNHDITMTNAMANTDYVVIVASDQNSNVEDAVMQVGISSTTVFNVYANAGAGGIEPDSYHFMVLSNA
jgi:hypothetical protein